jgi:hypothetical protein
VRERCASQQRFHLARYSPSWETENSSRPAVGANPASTAIRERRRTLRYRNLLVRQMVQMKIKISALLMEAGVS